MKPQPPIITLERYATLQARIDRGERLAAVLGGENLGFETWRSAQAGWLAMLGAEARRGKQLLARRYQEAYLAERPDLLPPPADGKIHLDGTALALNLDLGASLPFMAAVVDPAGERRADDTVMPAELKRDLDETPPAHDEQDLDGTSAVIPALLLESTLPFETPSLTLEQYASLCAECDVNPAGRAGIEQKYGLSTGERARLDAAWQKRLARDAQAAARFRDLVLQYARWLKLRG